MTPKLLVLGIAAVAAIAATGSATSSGVSPPAEKIAFASTRDGLTITPAINGGEIYLMNPDGSGVQRLTHDSDAAAPAGDGFATLNPTGNGRIVFDSNRNRAPGEAVNTSDLFLMNADGTDQTFLVRGGSPSWNPHGTHIAFHASASGSGTPILGTPGAATTDSDIFIADVAAVVGGAGPGAENITNDPTTIDDDPDWSPAGTKIAYTSHPAGGPHGNATGAEIYVLDLETRERVRLTHNLEEERGPAWSPDGGSLAYACRKGTGPSFEICVVSAEGDQAGVSRLTSNTAPDLTPSWSPDGGRIMYHSGAAGDGLQLWVMSKDGTNKTKLTGTPGTSLLANWGELETTPPSITITEPGAGATYVLGQVALSDFSCSDNGWLVRCSGPVAIETSWLGFHTFTVAARDAAANSSQSSVEYAVAYGVCALYDDAKAHKLGSTIAIKLQLCDATGANVSSAGTSLHVVSLTRVGDAAEGEFDDAGNANADADFRYDDSLGETGGYILNHATKGLSVGTWELRFTASGDPTSHTVQFRVR